VKQSTIANRTASRNKRNVNPYVIQNLAKLVTIGLSKTIRLNQTIVNNRIESDGSFGKRPIYTENRFA
jgi:hypothetical protein